MKESIMQHEKETLWRRTVTLLSSISLSLAFLGFVARAYGAQKLSYVLFGMGICLLLGFLIRVTLPRRRS